MKTWQSIFLGFLLGLLSSGIILLLSKHPSGKPLKILPPPISETITIHITGEVNQPGVYALPMSSRAIDAVEAAGNFTPQADKESVNLARKISDGEFINIQKKAHSEPSIEPTQYTKSERADTLSISSTNPLNINTATIEELQILPDIGVVKADQIIKYRETYGNFLQIEDIMNVPGIGSQLYENIKLLITTGE